MTTIIKHTDFSFTNQINLERGLIKDKYFFSNHILLEIITDRLILDGNLLQNGISNLGQLITSLGFKLTQHLEGYFKTNVLKSPEINFCFRLANNDSIKFYIGDHLNGLIWKEYRNGKRDFGLLQLNNNLTLNTKLDKQLILIYTKDNFGNYKLREINDKSDSLNVELPESLFLIQKKLKEVFKAGKNHAFKTGYNLAGATYTFSTDKNRLIINDFIHNIDNAIYFKIQKDNSIENLNLYEYFEDYVELNRNRKNSLKEPELKELEEFSNKCIRLYKDLTGNEFVPFESKNLISELLKTIHQILKEIKLK